MEARDLPRGQRVLFGVLAIALPFLFFATLEGGLRLVGYGHDYPLFEDVPGFPGYLQTSQSVGRRYFSRMGHAPNIPFDSFQSENQPGTARIFVQGGSTAAGFPFNFGGSFVDMLEQRLLQSYPERNIEVVSTAMAAVNSYTLLDLAPEIIAQRPDAVLIYAGHNEYYGALGVGSTESFGPSVAAIRLYLRLQDLRVVQGLRFLLAHAANVVTGPDAGTRPEGTLMERMVARQSIPFGSRDYTRGMEQFEANLETLLEMYEDAGIPVYIGTLASNVRDHRPFISGRLPGADGGEWQRRYDEAVRLASTEPAAATRLAMSLVLEDSTSADAAFLLARLMEKAGDIPRAALLYARAKDLDQLRFRAPEQANSIIRAVAASHGATVVEVQAWLQRHSPNGLIGHALMTEHLHPNVDGYFLIADAFYRALVTEETLGPPDQIVPTDRARSEVLITPVDSLAGLYRVLSLTSSWPFKTAPGGPPPADTLEAGTFIGDLAWRLYHDEITRVDALEEQYDHFVATRKPKLALKSALAVIQRYPFLPRPYVLAASVMVSQGRLDEALYYCEASLDRRESGEAHMLMGSILLQQGHRTESIQHLEQSLSLEPGSVQAMYNLAGAYALEGNRKRAIALTDSVLAIEPDHKAALELRGSLGG